MRVSRLTLACMLVPLVWQSPAFTQDMTETCAGQPTLDGSDTFGFVEAPAPASDDFAMSNCDAWDPTNCSAGSHGWDRVVCFTPTSNCTVLVENVTGNQGAAAHVFIGPCVSDPASCVASISEDDNAVLLPSVSLIGGTQYCVVTERCGGASMSITINQIGGTDCGPLPVELQSFTVD